MAEDSGIKEIQSIHSRILDLPPSCIEFSPIARDYFIVGTYYLEKNEDGNDATKEDEENTSNSPEEKKAQSRRGSLILFRYVNDELTLLQTLPTPSALLDLHFSPHDPSIFATATSTGTLSLYQLSLPSDTSPAAPASIQHLSTYQILDPSTLVLAFAFHPVYSNLLGVSLSNGDISIYQIPSASTSSTGIRKVWTSSSAHSLEAWTLSFSPDGSTFFSGGDDSKLQAYAISDVTPQSDEVFKSEAQAENDEEVDEETELDEPVTLWSDTKTHGAGVTAILPLSIDDDASAMSKILITGSYDDHIRVYEYPAPGLPGRRKVLAETYLEGGVWRLKLLKGYETSDDARDEGNAPDGTKSVIRVRVLASCMHAGARVVEITRDAEGQWDIAVLAKFEEHKSMNYGSDVQPFTEGEDNGKAEARKEFTIMSTSFYDRLLCVWKCER
ncbi:WD40 repeat-like protein [Xylona heveae TC161]|uniref:methylated diphthine methylhydrolase n=1 Tax=Xylona heveae (strain CBS 132557 / TC161) TaxID=1328760 RepID=A0A165G787_XYLHT|nr:WD40 repeat-like protein [Xylona heveae TC161]KZF21821.1 WD40 repeat-like protein [Xylona heveae TC161]